MEPGDREALDHFVRNREGTIRLLERVPEEWLARKAEGEDMSLGWLFMHVARGPEWWMEHCMRDGKGWRREGRGPFDRNTIREALTSSIARVESFFERDGGKPMGMRFELLPEKTEGEGEWSGRNRVLYFADHETHHRGKLVLALRQWGMKEFPGMLS